MEGVIMNKVSQVLRIITPLRILLIIIFISILPSQASATLSQAYSSDAVNGTTSGVPTVLKSITITQNYAGTMQFKFDLKTDGAQGDPVAYIQKNGVTIGSSKTVHGLTTYTTFTQDIGVSLVTGDIITLVGYVDSGYYNWIQNFRLYTESQNVFVSVYGQGYVDVFFNGAYVDYATYSHSVPMGVFEGANTHQLVPYPNPGYRLNRTSCNTLANVCTIPTGTFSFTINPPTPDYYIFEFVSIEPKTITLNKWTGSGFVSVKKNGVANGELMTSESSEVFSFDQGDTFTFEAIPSAGNTFEKFCKQADCTTTITSNPYTGTVLNDESLYVFFNTIPTPTPTPTPGPTVNPTPQPTPTPAYNWNLTASNSSGTVNFNYCAPSDASFYLRTPSEVHLYTTAVTANSCGSMSKNESTLREQYGTGIYRAMLTSSTHTEIVEFLIGVVDIPKQDIPVVVTLAGNGTFKLYRNGAYVGQITASTSYTMQTGDILVINNTIPTVNNMLEKICAASNCTTEYTKMIIIPAGVEFYNIGVTFKYYDLNNPNPPPYTPPPGTTPAPPSNPGTPPTDTSQEPVVSGLNKLFSAWTSLLSGLDWQARAIIVIALVAIGAWKWSTIGAGAGILISYVLGALDPYMIILMFVAAICAMYYKFNRPVRV